MCDPGELRQLRADALQQLLDVRLHADIGREGVDAALVALGDLLDRLLRLRARLPSAGQHDVAGPELGEVRRRAQTDGTAPTGDQIAPITARLQASRLLAHDLSDVPGLLHAAERRP